MTLKQYVKNSYTSNVHLFLRIKDMIYIKKNIKHILTACLHVLCTCT